MANLTSSSIRLDGQTYNLARNEDVRRVLGASGRRWNVARKRVATKRIPRPDVRPGDIEGEWIITWDDWSKGIAGDYENLPGTYHFTFNVDCTVPGAIKGVHHQAVITDAVTDYEGDPVSTILFNNKLYIYGNRYLFRVGNDSSLTSIKDFGTGKSAKDAVVHNGLLVIAMGETEKMYTMNTAETTTQATDATYASYLTVVQGRLKRGKGTNQVSSIGLTDDPLVLANWSSDIAVGDASYAITQLVPYGERLAVCKTDGLYLSQQTELLFENVLPQIKPEADNGRLAISRGSDIFYPHSDSALLRYNNGVAEEVGLPESFRTSIKSSLTIPGITVSGLLADRQYIYMSSGAPLFPRDHPDGFLKTTDNESSFTNLLANVTDNDATTYSSLASLDTAANGDYFYIGWESAFWGVFVEVDLGAGNANNSALTAQYWNGSAWTALPTDSPLIDSTANAGATLAKTGFLSWRTAPGDWANKTINTISATWMRFSVSAALSAVARIREMRVVTAAPRAMLYKGRPHRKDDVRGQSIVWDSLVSSSALGTYINAIGISRSQPFSRQFPGLVLGGQQATLVTRLSENGHEQGTDGAAGSMMFCRHDGGMPEVNKQFLSLTLKGSVIDANHTVDLQYNLNDQTNTLTVAANNIATSPSTTTLSGVTGYAIQPYINIDAFASDSPTEINELECRFRELPTYKNEYTMILELADGQIDAEGVMLPDASVQLSNLEGDHGAAAVALIDPLNRSKTVTVHSVQEIEYLQDGVDYPRLLVECRCTEI